MMVPFVGEGSSIDDLQKAHAGVISRQVPSLNQGSKDDRETSAGRANRRESAGPRGFKSKQAPSIVYDLPDSCSSKPTCLSC